MVTGAAVCGRRCDWRIDWIAVYRRCAVGYDAAVFGCVHSADDLDAQAVGHGAIAGEVCIARRISNGAVAFRGRCRAAQYAVFAA